MRFGCFISTVSLELLNNFCEGLASEYVGFSQISLGVIWPCSTCFVLLHYFIPFVPAAIQESWPLCSSFLDFPLWSQIECHLLVDSISDPNSNKYWSSLKTWMKRVVFVRSLVACNICDPSIEEQLLRLWSLPRIHHICGTLRDFGGRHTSGSTWYNLGQLFQ